MKKVLTDTWEVGDLFRAVKKGEFDFDPDWILVVRKIDGESVTTEVVGVRVESKIDDIGTIKDSFPSVGENERLVTKTEIKGMFVKEEHVFRAVIGDHPTKLYRSKGEFFFTAGGGTVSLRVMFDLVNEILEYQGYEKVALHAKDIAGSVKAELMEGA